MPRSGTGTYTLPPGTDFSNGTTADGPEVQAAFNDVASALSGSLAADGQTALAGNLNAGGYTITNVRLNGVDCSLSGQYQTSNPGTAALPTYQFTDVGSGFYRVSSNTIAIAASSAPVMTIGPTYTYLMNGQLRFPASQSPSSDANTLDDYEEGSWTPAGNVVTLTVNAAKYIKIGKIVHAWFDVTWPSTSDTSSSQIRSLPFVVDSTMIGTVSIAYQTYSTAITGAAQNNTTYCDLFALGGANVTNAALSGRRVVGCATFMAST